MKFSKLYELKLNLSSAPLMMMGGSGGTLTVSLASRERIGATPSAAPT